MIGRHPQSLKVIDEAVRLEHNKDIARSPDIMVVQDCTGQGRVRQLAFHDRRAWHGQRHTVKLAQFGSNGPG